MIVADEISQFSIEFIDCHHKEMGGKPNMDFGLPGLLLESMLFEL
jgi:hypothetical protein